MDNHPSSPITAAVNTEFLADLPIHPGVLVPLGGLNPYNPYFDKIGVQFKNLLIGHAGLTLGSRVLDVGCGTGRLAKQLVPFLDRGYYCGFDVHPKYVEYCKEHYKGNCEFARFDLFHDEYNRFGTIDPLGFEFPYLNNSFDVVAVVAVFNHFRIEWVCHYLGQVGRVLRPRGVLLATILLLSHQSVPFIGSRVKPPYQFGYKGVESWYDFESRPLFNVAHSEAVVRRAMIRGGLMIREPIRYGEWCEAKHALAGPDMLIAVKMEREE